MRRSMVIAALAVSTSLLACPGCGNDRGATPPPAVGSAAAPSAVPSDASARPADTTGPESAGPETADPRRTGAAAVAFRDSLSIGESVDPAVAELAGILGKNDRVTLELTLFTPQALAGSAHGWYRLAFHSKDFGGQPAALVLSVPGDNVTVGSIDEGDFFVTVSGTFAVAESSGSGGSYRLTPDGDKPLPVAAEDERMCAEESTQRALADDAQRLVDNPDGYPTLRTKWQTAPRLWWAVKSTTATLIESDGQVTGDGMSTACAAFG